MAKIEINLNENRTFGDLIGAPFQFVFQEFKTLFGSILKYSSPFLVLTIIFFVLAFRQSDNYTESYDSMNVLMIFGFFSGLLSILAMLVTFYSYISLYSKMGKGNFSINNVGDLLKRNVFKVFGGIVLSAFIVLAASFLVRIPAIGYIIAYFGIIYLSVSLSFFMIIIVNEDENVGSSFSKSFQLIKGNWWFTFAVYFVFILIVTFSAYLITFLLLFIVGLASFGAGGGIIFLVLGLILSLFIYVFFLSLIHSLISLVYFKLKVIKEGPDLMDRIAKITNEEPELVEKETDKKQLKEETEDNEENRFEGDDDLNRFKPKY